jgi:hypothetical protein
MLEQWVKQTSFVLSVSRASRSSISRSSDFQVVAVLVHPPFANHHALRLKLAPGAVVGLVILVGHDDLVTGRQQRPQGVGQNVDVAGGRRPDDDLVHVGVDHRGKRGAAFGDPLGAQGRGLVSLAGLDLAVRHEMRGTIDYLLRYQGAAGVFHENPFSVQGRKMMAAEFNVEDRFRGHIRRHSPIDIQIRGNRTTGPPPRELHLLCSHPMARF